MAFQWPSTSSKATAQTLLRTWLSRLSHTRRTMMSTTVDGLPSFLHSSQCTQLKKEEVAAFSTLKTPFLRCKRNFIFPFNLSFSFSLPHNSPHSFHLHLFSPTHSFLHTHTQPTTFIYASQPTFQYDHCNIFVCLGGPIYHL